MIRISYTRYILLIIFLAITLSFAGCVRKNPSIARKEFINGQTYTVLKDSSNSSTAPKYYDAPLQLSKLNGVYHAYYLTENDLVKIVPSQYLQNFIMVQDYYKNEEYVLQEVSSSVDNFWISPQKKKIMYYSPRVITIIDISKKNNITLEPEDMIIEESICWIDEENIMYSNVNGDIIVHNIENDSKFKYSMDSIHKTQLAYSNGRIVYLSVPESNVHRMDKRNELYPFYDEYSRNNGNSLNFVEGDFFGTIIDSINSYNIKAYNISPDGRKIALYFEDKLNNSKLFIASISEGMFSLDIESRGLIHISNDTVSAMAWNKDSSKLSYSVRDGDIGLYIVNADGSDSARIVTDRYIKRIDWSESGNVLLAERKDETGHSIIIIKISNYE